MNNINALFRLCFTNITQSWFRNCYVVNRLWFESWCVCPSGLELFRLSQKARPPHRKKKAPVAPGGHLISIQVQRVLVELANCRRRRSSSKNLKKDKMYYWNRKRDGSTRVAILTIGIKVFLLFSLSLSNSQTWCSYSLFYTSSRIELRLYILYFYKGRLFYI